MENKNNDGFSYNYSAKEQAELKKIREKYLPSEETKLDRLRRLDREAFQRAQTAAIIVGVIGALILGFGMSLAISELGAALGLSATLSMIVGIAVGLVGCALVGLAYPIYNAVLKRERAKIAPEIIRLTDELMK